MSRYSLGTIASIRLLIITKIIYTYILLPYTISRHLKIDHYAINYTDYHDVDEDLRTILEQGGKWQVDVHAGTMIRQLSDGISYAGNVASMENNL